MELVELVLKNLKKFRKEKGFQQNELAEKMGVAPSHYSRIEVGKVEPTISSLEKIAIALGIEAYEFFLDPDDEKLPVIEKFKKFEQLPEEEKEIIVRMIDITLEREKMKRNAI